METILEILVILLSIVFVILIGLGAYWLYQIYKSLGGGGYF